MHTAIKASASSPCLKAGAPADARLVEVLLEILGKQK
jgi:hypothetical protein